MAPPAQRPWPGVGGTRKVLGSWLLARHSPMDAVLAPWPIWHARSVGCVEVSEHALVHSMPDDSMSVAGGVGPWAPCLQECTRVQNMCIRVRTV